MGKHILIAAKGKIMHSFPLIFANYTEDPTKYNEFLSVKNYASNFSRALQNVINNSMWLP